MKIYRIASALLLAVLFCVLAVLSASAAPPTPTAPHPLKQKIVNLQSRGSTTLSRLVTTTTSLDKPDTPRDAALALKRTRAVNRAIPRHPNSRLTALSIPEVAGLPISTNSLGFRGFSGLNHRDQRLAYGGNQFSLEPPDQGLCVGKSFVLEAVNDAVRVYSTGGVPLTGAIALNQFFGFAPSLTRPNGPYGPFVFDPKCYYDPDTDRWFLTATEWDTDPVTGDYLSHTELDIAVSRTNDPRGMWNLFAINTINDGTEGTVTHPDCPCIPDQPLIGADSNGFYISVNEFGISTFNGTVIYALNKRALASGYLTSILELDVGLLVPVLDEDKPDGIWYSLQPATAPNKMYELGNKGTEYFLSTLDFTGTLDNRIAVWALTNTASLRSIYPTLYLDYRVLGSETYGMPPPANQKLSSSTPLRNCLIANCFGLGVSAEPLEQLDTNDDRMQQVVFANGKLWSGLGSVLHVTGDTSDDRAGIAYFVVQPDWSGGVFSASMSSQGYIAVKGSHVMFPSIGMADNGKGAMVFTLSGTNYYPSMAYTRLGATSAPRDIRIGGAGRVPEDGHTGYLAYGNNGISRWGDYSAAVASGGKIWMAAEYTPQSSCNKDLSVCKGRTALANWGTFIGSVIP